MSAISLRIRRYGNDDVVRPNDKEGT